MSTRYMLTKELHGLDAKIQKTEDELRRLKKQRTSVGDKLTRLSMEEAASKMQMRPSDRGDL